MKDLRGLIKTTECPICKGNLIEIKHGSSITYKCTNCDYSVVTTDIDLIYDDETIYTINLLSGNNINKATVSLLKSITGLPTTEIISLIKTDKKCLIYKGTAYDIRTIKQKLEKINIKFDITPKAILIFNIALQL